MDALGLGPAAPSSRNSPDHSAPRRGRGEALRSIWLMALALGLSACGASESGGSGAPMQGTWDGVDLSFFLSGATLTEVTLKAPLSCTGEDGCKGSVSGKVDGQFLVAPLGGLGQTAAGPVTLAGQFSSSTAASGSIEAQAGSCCKVIAAWAADWVPGTQPGLVADVTGGTTSKGWGAHSTGTLAPPAPRAPNASLVAATEPFSPNQLKAQALLEQLRAQLGIPPCSQAPPLAQAAQAHADFYVAWGAKYTSTQLSPHSEDPSYGDGFTGQSPSARVSAAGWGNSQVVEVMAFSGSPSGAINGWLETVYHRFPLVDPTSKDMGYGQASATKYKTEVMEVGGGNTAPPGVVVYPWPGQTGVPAVWYGNEGPQPPPPPKGYPSGPVISARFATAVQVTGHFLRGPDGKDIAHVWLDAQNDQNLSMFDAKQKVLYAHKPLTPGVHVVRIEANVAGQPEVVEWDFTVGP